jgi:hypothetical protein
VCLSAVFRWRLCVNVSRNANCRERRLPMAAVGSCSFSRDAEANHRSATGGCLIARHGGDKHWSTVRTHILTTFYLLFHCVLSTWKYVRFVVYVLSCVVACVFVESTKQVHAEIAFSTLLFSCSVWRLDVWVLCYDF